ncbi:hypothetical protein BCR34DRAFT_585244 [Clohesyomyces aquaticus]|uniref:Uncharacterized protein n=1 Tax=Clohesyomyces aquaticus TaxID=1231657 RepID=A0A1Y1ZXX6_9PLEO|nr:hypothetical protein BCR34DRAFT_585244 [Clohesyomyces aquaticus]
MLKTTSANSVATMLISSVPLLLCSVFSGTVIGAVHPAKRQFNTISEICGPNPVDCHNGWCCMTGQECIPASGNDEPQCRDNILTDLGGDPLTVLAFPYSSVIAGISSANSVLESLGITLSKLPTVTALPTTGKFTVLPTYTENSVKSFVPPTRMPSVPAATPTTGAAALPTINVGVMVGGIMGAGMGVMAAM